MLFSLLLAAHAAETFADRAYYLGDLHVHTGLSGDGYSSDLGGCPWEPCGSAEGVLDTAKAQGLDFVAITDHVTGGYAVQDVDGFAEQWERVLAGNDPDGGFVTVPGVELDAKVGEAVLGHKNLLLFGDRDQLAGLGPDDLRVSASGVVESCDDLWLWTESRAKVLGPLLLAPHHPAPSSPSPTDWSCHSETWQPTVEVYSEHGNSVGGSDDFDPPFNETVKTGTVSYALGAGVKLGFHASTDTHDSMPGDTCSSIDDDRLGGGLAVAVLDDGERFDRSSLHRALIERRTYGTSGPLVPVELAWSVGGELVGGLGDSLVLGSGGSVRVELAVPAEHAALVTEVALVLPDGDEVLAQADDACWSLDTVVTSFAWVRVTLDGGAWYGDEGCDDKGADDRERLWLSPSWVTLDEVAAGEHAPVLCGAGVDDSGGDTDPAVGDTQPPPDSPAVEDEAVVRPEPSCACGGVGAVSWAWGVVLVFVRRRRVG